MGNKLAITIGSICALVSSVVPIGLPNSAEALIMDYGKHGIEVMCTNNPDNSCTSRTPSHWVGAGETLSGICLDHYGNGTASVYNCVADYNGIDPNKIDVGDRLSLPSYCD